MKKIKFFNGGIEIEGNILKETKDLIKIKVETSKHEKKWPYVQKGEIFNIKKETK